MSRCPIVCYMILKNPSAQCTRDASAPTVLPLCFGESSPPAFIASPLSKLPLPNSISIDLSRNPYPIQATRIRHVCPHELPPSVPAHRCWWLRPHVQHLDAARRLEDDPDRSSGRRARDAGYRVGPGSRALLGWLLVWPVNGASDELVPCRGFPE